MGRHCVPCDSDPESGNRVHVLQVFTKIGDIWTKKSRKLISIISKVNN